MQDEFYSHGKLLITGEYTILNGAIGLAVPTKKGQKMVITSNPIFNNSILNWKAFNFENNIWFEAEINYKSWKIASTNNAQYSNNLIVILKEAVSKSDFFKNKSEDFFVETYLEFPNNWGLGSSSTFINNIAKWLQVDPFQLLFDTIGGSGYDIACASNNKPILYGLAKENPIVRQVNFLPIFKENLYFVHLNKKKETSSALTNYLKNNQPTLAEINKITEITHLILETTCLNKFSDLISEHETILSSILKVKPIKEDLFKDYPHAIKSLGAWGGDFILVVAKNKQDLNYFIDKQYTTILSYQEMIL